MKIACAIASVLLLGGSMGGAVYAAEGPWSVRAANAAMERWLDGRTQPAGAALAFTHDQGTLLDGLDAVWLDTADPRYFDYIKSSVDLLVGPDGSLPTLKPGDHHLLDFQLGRQLLLLYGATQDQRYYKAATALYKLLAEQPRNPLGGFWTSQKQPNQMTVDALYEAELFYAGYARAFHHPEAFHDITAQFALVDEHARDAKTGLLRQGWDQSKQERWADPTSGVSSQAWGRGMGWAMMALVEAIPEYPEYDSGRKQLLDMLARDAAAVARYQDANGLWSQVLDKAGEKGNYEEASASCMFVYALAKGVRLGYLPAHYLMNAERGYKGILSHFIETGAGGDVTLKGTVAPTDLGGVPYKDGSYEFYTSLKTVTNSPMGVGAFLMASTEMENAQNAKLGRGQTVVLDAWFNSQMRADVTGQQVYFHYKWDDVSNSGYSLFGHIWRNFGAETRTLYVAPTVENLRSAKVYMIVSPDIPAKNPNPHYANSEDATQIAEWVKAGGVLLIMENDTSFADLEHFNVVSEKFGIHFNSILRKHVEGSNWAQGRVDVAAGGPVFHSAHTIYVKDVCTITATGPAKAVLSDGGDVLMAVAKYGKGTVFAMTDPWLYNEYTNGRILPPLYDNFAGGVELVRWALEQIPHTAVAAKAAEAAKSARQ